VRKYAFHSAIVADSVVVGVDFECVVGVVAYADDGGDDDGGGGDDDAGGYDGDDGVYVRSRMHLMMLRDHLLALP
jgi:hypothetical protein